MFNFSADILKLNFTNPGEPGHEDLKRENEN